MRRVWTYLPAGYDASPAVYPTVYFLDGGNYADWMQVPSVLDQLIAAKSISADHRRVRRAGLAAGGVFAQPGVVDVHDQRARAGDRQAAPRLPAPDRRVIFGSSLGAYGAVNLAVETPDVFGLCAAIAPPAQAATLLTNQEQGVRAVHGVRFFVLGAVYDTDVKGARTLRSALNEARADVTYVEMPEGHAAETFRGRIDDALHHLIPVEP